MVGHGNSLGTDLGANLLEIIIAQVAAGHLGRDAVLPHVGARVKPDAAECRAETRGQRARMGLVAVSLRSAQAEVAVNCREPVAQPRQNGEQRRRIGAAAQSDNHAGAGLQKALRADERRDAVSKGHFLIPPLTPPPMAKMFWS